MAYRGLRRVPDGWRCCVMAGRSGIKIKKSNKGKLRKSLGAKKGKKIPASKLKKAANSSNPTTRKRAQFALNARKWKKS
jgi:hypothetical protein